MEIVVFGHLFFEISGAPGTSSFLHLPYLCFVSFDQSVRPIPIEMPLQIRPESVFCLDFTHPVSSWCNMLLRVTVPHCKYSYTVYPRILLEYSAQVIVFILKSETFLWKLGLLSLQYTRSLIFYYYYVYFVFKL